MSRRDLHALRRPMMAAAAIFTGVAFTSICALPIAVGAGASGAVNMA